MYDNYGTGGVTFSVYAPASLFENGGSVTPENWDVKLGGDVFNMPSTVDLGKQPVKPVGYVSMLTQAVAGSTCSTQFYFPKGLLEAEELVVAIPGHDLVTDDGSVASSSQTPYLAATLSDLEKVNLTPCTDNEGYMQFSFNIGKTTSLQITKATRQDGELAVKSQKAISVREESGYLAIPAGI